MEQQHPTDTTPRVLVTDGVHPLLLEGLTAAGYTCTYLPKIDLETTRQLVGEYQGIIINSKILVDRAFLEGAPYLKFIGRLGSGLEIIDLEAAREHQVAVIRAADGNCDAVAEHALGMLLSLANNLRQADQQVRQFVWEREQNRGWELWGKTIGIVGFGYTGRAFAQRLAGFGMKILAYDKYKTNYATDLPQVQECSMDQLFAEAQILSLHLPATTETKGMADEKYWKCFQNQLVVVNTSRGNIVPTKDLVKALKEGRLKGACLDVFENEKPITYNTEETAIFQQLFQQENVLLSPHVAGWTSESKERLAKLLLHRIMKL
ncbi:MAG: NAD(P)-dependent oxidoreductase [Aureispira sp.]